METMSMDGTTGARSRSSSVADSHDLIRVQGARVNNLKDVSVEIPKRRLTVFTGVSGSGKSSLVFSTIAAESQRLINETYSTFVQNFMPTLARPEVDRLDGLTPAIIVDQERMGANSRSTVGTATDTHAMLRILFSRLGEPSAGSSLHYSFNLPQGWCLTDFLYKEPTKVKMQGINMTYEGLVPRITKSFLQKDRDALQPHIRAFVDRAVAFATCPECHGARLNEAARAAKIDGVSIADAAAMQISDLGEWLRTVDDPRVAPLVEGLLQTVDSFVEIGLGYLSLDRASGTLSGGEAQRTKMIRHMGSSLTDVTYVFDEPTAGLHPHDIQRMNGLLRRLRDKGNTVLVVEHKPEVIEIADHIIDLGPGAGPRFTGRHLDHRAQLKPSTRPLRDSLEIRGATQHNLCDVDVDIPLGVLTVVTGVAGSGKSSLIHGNLPAFDDVVVVDQSPIRGSRRSNPATYTGLLDTIRSAFAKANGVKPALFSANSAGACPECKGLGVILTDLGFNSTVESVCEVCDGTGFTDEVLEYRLDGRNIHEVMSMSVTEAREFIGSGPAHTTLSRMVEVGLGYITLGQALNTLSGGERQRLKLAISMAKKGAVYVLDEPTTGLHLADVDNLLDMLDRLVETGNSVIVIEHHQAVMAHADWIIDLGPGAGHDGGRIVFEGTPADLAAARSTLTGEHLAAYVGVSE